MGNAQAGGNLARRGYASSRIEIDLPLAAGIWPVNHFEQASIAHARNLPFAGQPDIFVVIVTGTGHLLSSRDGRVSEEGIWPRKMNDILQAPDPLGVVGVDQFDFRVEDNVAAIETLVEHFAEKPDDCLAAFLAEFAVIVPNPGIVSEAAGNERPVMYVQASDITILELIDGVEFGQVFGFHRDALPGRAAQRSVGECTLPSIDANV